MGYLNNQDEELVLISIQNYQGLLLFAMNWLFSHYKSTVLLLLSPLYIYFSKYLKYFKKRIPKINKEYSTKIIITKKCNKWTGILYE